MKQLSHNGILIPKYEPKGFGISFRGKKIALAPGQEEMAVAWVKKLGTEYAEDKVFVRNFFEDFCRALGIGKASPEDFDFSEIKNFVERERGAKEKMSKEEKKRLAAERKVVREANREKYGYAVIDGQKVELGNYMAEPSSIFMGRGKHPLRGKWKEGAKESDVVLNISPDSKVPAGKWKAVMWNPDYLWIAKWDDKLRGKEKYVWLSDTSPMKQEREMEKFDKAKDLENKFEIIQKHIEKNLDSEDIKKRKIATVCYLIDALSMRVGDEKDEDEADTCIPSGEFILGHEYKIVESFKIGDLLLDGKGNFTPIINLFKRPYTGEIVKIHGYGLFTLALTGNHPVLTAQRIGEIGDTFNFKEMKFKAAKELTSSDFLVFSKLKTNNKNYKIDLTRYQMLERRKGPKKIKLNENLAEFFGIYLAEGCSIIEHPEKNRHEGRIILTFGFKEVDLAKRVASLANSLFQRKVRILKEESCIRVIFFSLQLARFLRENFGTRSYFKKIPEFIMNAPSPIVKTFIQAYFAGDAFLRISKHHNKYNYKRLVLTATSRTVALQLQKLLSKIDIFAPISLKGGKTKTILGHKVKTLHTAYHITVGGKAIEKLGFRYEAKRFRPRYFDAKNYFYIPIKKIEKNNYNGNVYNFKTINGTFEVSNITVHNCGATTLTPKNITICQDNLVKFDFIGKDYVKWEKEIVLPGNVVRNMKEFIANPKSFVFDGVRSENVNAFLSEIVDGITAKVFRTYHASKAVREYLEKNNANENDSIFYKKYIAAMANLQAAIVCNHKRKLPKKWKESLAKKNENLKKLKLKKGKKTKERVKELKLKIKLMKEAKDYNLNTSLKSYIDPRIFYKWSKKNNFDWKKYYSKTLQKKFSWVEKSD